jgi:hypothetical protein
MNRRCEVWRDAVALPALAVLPALAALLWPSLAAAQATPAEASSVPASHVLGVRGSGGRQDVSGLFDTQGAARVGPAEDRWQIRADHRVWLAEDPARAPARIAARGTREAMERELGAIAARAGATDRVLIVLIGHGTAAGESSKVNLPGPDLTGEDLAGWLAAFPTQIIAVVNTASASGGFIAPLSSPRRIVVTATRSAREAERTHFAEFFIGALAADGADTDKDRRVSLLEAFEFARAEVERFYERENLMRTEHALLDDDGDGEGTAEPATAGSADGALAGAFLVGDALGAAAASGTGDADGAAGDEADPQLAGLQAERTRIETAITALRARRTEMAAVAYESEQEDLLLALARVNRSIRDAGGSR